MTQEVWKEFEENTLTHSAAHYLMTIHDLLNSNGYARVTDVAKSLHITRGSCSISLKPLKKRGLVLEDDNKFLRLSEQGLRLAEFVEKNDELLENFFQNVLGVEPNQAEIDACKIEHLLSISTSMKLAAFMQFVNSGEEIAQEFVSALRKREPACTHVVEKCPTCETVCLEETDTDPTR
jgi:Mn-dependent DtxR family transcriptional regulator